MCVYQRVTQECITFFAFIWWQFSSKMFKKRVIQESVVWKRVQRTVCRTMTHFRKPKEDQLEGQRRHLQKTFEVKKTMVLSPKKTGCFNQKKQKNDTFLTFHLHHRVAPRPSWRPTHRCSMPRASVPSAPCSAPCCTTRRRPSWQGNAAWCGGGNQGEDAGETYGNLCLLLKKHGNSWETFGKMWWILGKSWEVFFIFKLGHHW